MPKTSLPKRKGVYIKLFPETIKALDAVAETFQTSRIEVIELALCSLFNGAIEIISENGVCKSG